MSAQSYPEIILFRTSPPSLVKTGAGHPSGDTLGLGTGHSGRLWGWALQQGHSGVGQFRETLGLGNGVGHSRETLGHSLEGWALQQDSGLDCELGTAGTL